MTEVWPYFPRRKMAKLLIQLPGELAENFNASVKGNALCSVRLKVFKVDGPLPILPVICQGVGIIAAVVILLIIAGPLCVNSRLLAGEVVRVDAQANHGDGVLFLHQVVLRHRLAVQLSLRKALSP